MVAMSLGDTTKVVPKAGLTGPGAGTDRGTETPDGAVDTAGGVVQRPLAPEGKVRREVEARRRRRQGDERGAPGDAHLFWPPLRPDIFSKLAG